MCIFLLLLGLAWLIYCLLFLSRWAFYGGIKSQFRENKNRKIWLQLILGWFATELPLFVFFVLLSLNLDNKLDIAATKVMIPFYVMEGEVLLVFHEILKIFT